MGLIRGRSKEDLLVRLFAALLELICIEENWFVGLFAALLELFGIEENLFVRFAVVAGHVLLLN